MSKLTTLAATLIFLAIPYCFAQTNPMEYFYEGKDVLPDFAALAVLERQNCPRPVYLSYEKYKWQTCTSRYRIIKVLDAVSDTLRKEYIEVKEKPVSPYFRHRPMLIFGQQINGIFEIIGYEEIRNDGYYTADANHLGYMLHSIGTPYYNVKDLDSIDILSYKYMMSPYKSSVERVGKNFNELLLRLIYNRKPIKAAKIKNDFVALGTIRDMRLANDSKETNLYELNVSIKNIFKNDAKIDSNIAIFIEGKDLPLNSDCIQTQLSLLEKYAVYLFGDLKKSNLFIDSLIFPRDTFVFGDSIYDISMGFPLKELQEYFLPSNTSLEEFITILYDYGYKFSSCKSECMEKDFERIYENSKTFFYYTGSISEEQEMNMNYIGNLDGETKKLLLEEPLFNSFRNRQSDLKNKGVWGKKW